MTWAMYVGIEPRTQLMTSKRACVKIQAPSFSAACYKYDYRTYIHWAIYVGQQSPGKSSIGLYKNTSIICDTCLVSVYIAFSVHQNELFPDHLYHTRCAGIADALFYYLVAAINRQDFQRFL